MCAEGLRRPREPWGGDEAELSARCLLDQVGDLGHLLQMGSRMIPLHPTDRLQEGTEHFEQSLIQAAIQLYTLHINKTPHLANSSAFPDFDTFSQ